MSRWNSNQRSLISIMNFKKGNEPGPWWNDNVRIIATKNEKRCAANVDRTQDLQIFSLTLSQLSYCGRWWPSRSFLGIYRIGTSFTGHVIWAQQRAQDSTHAGDSNRAIEPKSSKLVDRTEWWFSFGSGQYGPYGQGDKDHSQPLVLTR